MDNCILNGGGLSLTGFGTANALGGSAWGPYLPPEGQNYKHKLRTKLETQLYLPPEKEKLLNTIILTT